MNYNDSVCDGVWQDDVRMGVELFEKCGEGVSYFI